MFEISSVGKAEFEAETHTDRKATRWSSSTRSNNGFIDLISMSVALTSSTRGMAFRKSAACVCSFQFVAPALGPFKSTHHQLLGAKVGSEHTVYRWDALSRFRCAACFARLPQIPMLHHRRALPRVWSAKSSVQARPSQAFTLEKSSVQTS